jgi:hypothetical protein
LSLRESHQRFRISQAEREAWIANMTDACSEAAIEEPFRSELLAFFETSSHHVVNQGPTSTKQLEGGTEISHELRRRWKAHRTLHEAVAAIRGADAPRALALAESPDIQLCGRNVLCGLIALMIRYGQPAMLEYAADRLNRDPSVAGERFAGRTLLHDAAAAGRLGLVELLLRLGLDPDIQDGGAHTPLYSVANECGATGAGEVVRALVRAGADVHAHEGVKRCTPLHMAARRGHLEVAEALLDSGAAIEARDSLGETPLRRAVNCSKPELAALLLSRGADLHSRDTKGSTPLLAARTAAMKEVLLRASRHGK